jgi:hypothetical protein
MLPKPLMLALGAARGAVLTAPLACATPGQGAVPSRPVVPSLDADGLGVHEPTRSTIASKGSHASVPVERPQSEPAPGFDAESLEALMRSMVDEIRSAQSPEDLDWVLSDLIVGGPLEGFLAAAIPALSHVPDEDLAVSATSLDRDLQDPVHRSLLSAEVALSLVHLSPDRPSGLAELLRGTDEPPSLQELLYGRLLPPAVQEALYAGHVAYLVLLTLLDERPMPQWLRSELRRKLVVNQHRYFGLLVAYAKKEGVVLPDSLASIEPLDLDAAEREAEREHRAVDSYLDGRRADRNRS